MTETSYSQAKNDAGSCVVVLIMGLVAVAACIGAMMLYGLVIA